MRTYNNLSIQEAFHPLSHHGNDAAKQDRLAVIQTYHTKMFAHFIDRLANAKDGDATLLENSMVLFGSNMSDSNRHNNDPLPSAVLGRAHGRIKGGQHLHYPAGRQALRLAAHAARAHADPGREDRRQRHRPRGGLSMKPQFAASRTGRRGGRRRRAVRARHGSAGPSNVSPPEHRSLLDAAKDGDTAAALAALESRRRRERARRRTARPR